MDHSHHGGGSGGGAGNLQATNMHLARSYWYLIAGVTGLAFIVRVVNHLEARTRLKRCHAESLTYPTKPSNRFSQAWATATAIIREATYPRLFIPLKGLRWSSPPASGRIITILAYWAVVLYMSVGHGAIINDIFFKERIGFRNAWTTMMQMPLLYLLSMKCNPIAYLAGTSHERLNWLHRWVGRTMFVTASIHGFTFWTHWLEADMFDWQMLILPNTKHGIGAWALLLWTLVTTIPPLRHMAYEVFVVQHVLTYVIFIWLVWVHIPTIATPYLWFSVACVVFDRLARIGLLTWQNLRAKPDRSNCKGMKRIGHQVQVRAVGASTTVITMKDVPFSWKPGQHLYLWLPRIAPLEVHPYTVACAHQLPHTCTCNSVQLVIRKHGGFSKRLHAHAQKMQDAGKHETMTALVIGPFGTPPRWDIYETLILISASTGASFTLPILEAAVQGYRRTCVKRVEFILMACQGEEIDFYVQQLREAVEKAQAMGLELTVHIAVTRSEAATSGVSSVLYGGAGPGGSTDNSSSSSLQQRKRISKNSETNEKEGAQDDEADAIDIDVERGSRSPPGPTISRTSGISTSSDFLREYSARPDIKALIREPVEASGGETSVVVCGGQSLTTSVRNCVASLSDERAVHKGTGAQGIHLFVEEYSF